jgi:lipoate-protein ligase A
MVGMVGMVGMVRQRGSVAHLHALDPFGAGPLGAPQVWWCDPTDAAIVLGSRQPVTTVDPVACATRGLAVVRRRSGGGSVLIRPDAVVWIDLVVPHGVAPDDVRGAMVWAGELWQSALGDVGALDGLATTVHDGGMIGSAWCDLVCFAGVGPGEVLAPAGKLVGLSQRRTRQGIRVQGMVHRRALGDDAVAVLAGPLPAEPLPDAATLPGLEAEAVAASLAERLGARWDHDRVRQ